MPRRLAITVRSHGTYKIRRSGRSAEGRRQQSTGRITIVMAPWWDRETRAGLPACLEPAPQVAARPLVPVGADEPLRLCAALIGAHIHHHAARIEVLTGAPQIGVGDAGDRLAYQGGERALPQPAGDLIASVRRELFRRIAGPAADMVPDTAPQPRGVRPSATRCHTPALTRRPSRAYALHPAASPRPIPQPGAPGLPLASSSGQHHGRSTAPSPADPRTRRPRCQPHIQHPGTHLQASSFALCGRPWTWPGAPTRPRSNSMLARCCVDRLKPRPLGADFDSAPVRMLSIRNWTSCAVLSAGAATVAAARRPGLTARAGYSLPASGAAGR